MYGAIRAFPNVVLVVGSGIGEAKQEYTYLTGVWSVPFGYAPMPLDGFLLGSRIMVAKEAHTLRQAKQLICDAPGIADGAKWTASYDAPTGGIVTVQSQMGQPIHKLATRGVLFWKEMEGVIFSLPRDKQVEVLHWLKTEIIQRLNEANGPRWILKR